MNRSEIVFKQFDNPDYFYLIVAGQIDILLKTK